MAATEPSGRQASRNPTSADAANIRPTPPADERVGAHLFDVSPFPGVVSRLADHTILAINARTSEMFAIPQDQVSGLTVTDYYVDSSQRQLLLDKLRNGGRADNLRIQLKRPDGSTF